MEKAVTTLALTQSPLDNCENCHRTYIAAVNPYGALMVGVVHIYPCVPHTPLLSQPPFTFPPTMIQYRNNSYE